LDIKAIKQKNLNSMKHLIFLFALALPWIGIAQHPQHKKELTQEERLTLHVKKMQLDLDLTEEQTKQLTKILRNNVPPQPPKKQEGISSKGHYKMQLNKLDHQIAIQNELKAILTESQFAAWKEMQRSRKRARGPHHRGRKGRPL